MVKQQMMEVYKIRNYPGFTKINLRRRSLKDCWIQKEPWHCMHMKIFLNQFWLSLMLIKIIRQRSTQKKESRCLTCWSPCLFYTVNISTSG